MSFYEPDTFEPDCSIGYLIRRCHQLGQVALEPVFQRHDVTSMQWQALVSIYFDRGSTSAELARDLGHDKGAMTRLVDTLEERGWITRTRACDDRRIVKLALTDEGRAKALACKSDIVVCWNAWLKDWGRDDVERMIAMLQRLRATMEAADGECA